MWSRPIRRLLRPVRLMAFTLLVAAWPLRAQLAPVGATLECPATAEPKQQPRVALVLAGPYAGQLSGRLTLTFVPNAAIPSDDASLQFSTGGRTAPLTLAAGSTRAEFSLQTGTVAGAIRINATLEAAGVCSVDDLVEGVPVLGDVEDHGVDAAKVVGSAERE